MTYQSISINHHDETNHNVSVPRKYRFTVLLATGVLAYISFDWLRIRLFSSGNSSPTKKSGAVVTDDSSSRLFHTATDSVPIPSGVNLGSWLSLEDWFYVGANGAVEVASPDDAVAASCLPPLHLDESTGPRWNSETDLLEGLGELSRRLVVLPDETFLILLSCSFLLPANILCYCSKPL